MSGGPGSGAALPSREEALALLHEWTENPNLRKHAYAVEAAMRSHAARAGGDPHAYGLAGLLHDFDYERFPSLEDHPFRGSEVLKEKGYPEWFRRAIFAHAPHTGVLPETDLEKSLFAVDELCGFLTACTLVLPSKAIRDLKVSSVRKRMKDKAFARNVSRDDITRGAELLGMDVDAHIGFVRDAMAAAADDLGLAGTPA
jgi:predicted hydrolase (HD superfamily)